MRKIRVSSSPAYESITVCFQQPNHHKRTLAAMVDRIPAHPYHLLRRSFLVLYLLMLIWWLKYQWVSVLFPEIICQIRLGKCSSCALRRWAVHQGHTISTATCVFGKCARVRVSCRIGSNGSVLTVIYWYFKVCFSYILNEWTTIGGGFDDGMLVTYVIIICFPFCSSVLFIWNTYLVLYSSLLACGRNTKRNER